MIRFKGKIAIWFWIVIALCEVVCIYACFDKEANGGIVAGIIGLLICNLIFLPMVIRNYVEVQEDKLIIAFGFSTETVNISDITEMYESCNPLASTAASLDRVIIKAGSRMLMCSVKEKTELFESVKEKNPNLKTR
ncbi:MAG: hypothetical protein E7261_06570 [Lachnospiraceae bacterium]|nr:hypothetical protein [Lachnospiraceae bacterium]